MRCKLSTRCNHLPPHWLEHGKTFVKFAMVGAAGLVVNLASFTFFLHLGINKYLASPMAIELSIINNFIFNNFWTFRSRQETKMLLTRAFRFNMVSFLTLLISYFNFIGLSLIFPNVRPQIHQAIAIIPSGMINYGLNFYWTFKGRASHP